MEARAPAVGEEAEEADKTEAALLTDVPKPKQGQDAAVAVAPAGDLVLQIRSCAGGARHRYRVDSARLRRASRFLRILLEPARFGEGVRTAQVLHDALRLHRSVEAVPEAELPCVDVTDPGRISLVNSIGPLMHDFLSILHDIDLRTYPPLANISNLAAVADRFDALPCFEDYARRRKWLHAIDGKYKAKAQPSRTSEDKARQKLMLGVLLGYPSWVGEYSQHLIIGGSLHWSDRGAPSPDGALWWDLPLAIEGI